MKITLFILVFIFISIACFGQKKSVKTDTTKKYDYFYRVSPGVMAILMNSAHELKENLVYDPRLTDAEVRRGQINAAKTIKEIESKMRLDSILIKPDSTLKPKTK